MKIVTAPIGLENRRSSLIGSISWRACYQISSRADIFTRNSWLTGESWVEVWPWDVLKPRSGMVAVRGKGKWLNTGRFWSDRYSRSCSSISKSSCPRGSFSQSSLTLLLSTYTYRLYWFSHSSQLSLILILFFTICILFLNTHRTHTHTSKLNEHTP